MRFFIAFLCVALCLVSVVAAAAPDVSLGAVSNPGELTPYLSGPDPIYIFSADTVIVDGVEVGEGSVAPELFAFSGSRPLAGGYYIDASTVQLGDLLIYVPIAYIDGYLTTTTGGNLFNLSASSISCIAFDSDGSRYNVRFNSFSTPQYRIFNGSGVYSDLTVREISDTNVRILDADAPQPIDCTVLDLVSIVLLGGIMVWIFCKL